MIINKYNCKTIKYYLIQYKYYVIRLINSLRFILFIGDIMIQKLALFLEKEMKRQNISSASKLAKLCNNKISPDFINKIKRQEPQTVTLDTLSIIAKGLNLSLKDLLEQSGIIEDYGNYGLSLEESNYLIKKMSPLLKQYTNINLKKLSDKEKVELANYIYEYIRMISYKYL